MISLPQEEVKETVWHLLVTMLVQTHLLISLWVSVATKLLHLATKAYQMVSECS